jgi:hypothetical protein
LDTTEAPPYKFFSFSVERAVMAPYMGLCVSQQWPYAPYHQMIVSLPYAARASLLFLSMAALTLLICGVTVDMRQIALLGTLFMLPFLILMSGYFPYPDFVPPAQLVMYQIGMLPVISLAPLVTAFFLLKKSTPHLPLELVLFLMALAMAGYVFIGLLPDEQKRNSTETLIQACLIGYVFFLTLYMRLRALGSSMNFMASLKKRLSRSKAKE